METTNTAASVAATKKAAWSNQQAEFQQKQAAVEAKKTEMQQKKDEMLAQKCAKIQERVAERSSNFEGIKEKHMSVYKNMADRISKFIDRLSGQGYDVSKIQADLVVLNEKIQKFSTDFSAQTAKLGETKDFACGHSDGEFRGKLAEARTEMQAVRADAADIRNYMSATVRPDILALKEQKKETNATVNADKSGGVDKPELE
jgi:uncharacterized protein YdhG (YjbR/CyaY superfamily)